MDAAARRKRGRPGDAPCAAALHFVQRPRTRKPPALPPSGSGGDQPMSAITRRVVACAAFAILLAGLPWTATPVQAADPIKVGFSMALTGGVAPNGKQNLLALEIWRDDVNAKGGLLGRPVELVYYDDQSNPNNVPGIYTKLISVDKVDLLIGPYATNMIAPAMPAIMQANKMTISMLGVNINRQFNYSRYFSMVPGGDEGTLAFS